MQSDENMPKWDVALASLARDACDHKGGPLSLEDFRGLARQHAIRFDDIMETMFLLVIHGQWSYRDRSGKIQRLGQETLDRLYVKRRLSEQDVAAFDGGWEPNQT
jgi:hypothetical protein